MSYSQRYSTKKSQNSWWDTGQSKLSCLLKMAGQGLKYLNVKDAYCLVYDLIRKMMMCLQKLHLNGRSPQIKSRKFQGTIAREPQRMRKMMHFKKFRPLRNQNLMIHLPQITVAKESKPWDPLVNTIFAQGLIDPIEILRFLQNDLIKGRMIDAVSESDSQNGVTNSICVDRHNILETTFSELASVQCFSLTLGVDFMGEQARDLGGPRKKWVHLMNKAIEEKYFDNGLRVHFCRWIPLCGNNDCNCPTSKWSTTTCHQMSLINQLHHQVMSALPISNWGGTCGLSHNIQCFWIKLHLLRSS